MQNPLYSWMHFAHLTVVMAWVALGAMSHAYLTRAARRESTDRQSDWRRARGLTLAGEMTCLAIVLVAGLALVAMDTSLFKEVWFHIKLLMVILVIAAFVLTSIRQRQVGALLAEGEIDRARKTLRAYTLFRVLTVIAATGLLIAVTFRFGRPETIAG